MHSKWLIVTPIGKWPFAFFLLQQKELLLIVAGCLWYVLSSLYAVIHIKILHLADKERSLEKLCNLLKVVHVESHREPGFEFRQGASRSPPCHYSFFYQVVHVLPEHHFWKLYCLRIYRIIIISGCSVH